MLLRNPHCSVESQIAKVIKAISRSKYPQGHPWPSSLLVCLNNDVVSDGRRNLGSLSASLTETTSLMENRASGLCISILDNSRPA
jgi:hypothetical protein